MQQERNFESCVIEGGMDSLSMFHVLWYKLLAVRITPV
jgi:hypothetical protein